MFTQYTDQEDESNELYYKPQQKFTLAEASGAWAEDASEKH